MTIIKSQKLSVRKDVEKLKPLCTVVRNVKCAVTMENIMEFPQQTKKMIQQSHLNTGSQRGLFTSTFTAVLLAIAKVWKPPKGSWTRVHNVGYLHNGMLLSVNKEGDPDTCYNTDEPGGHYASEISQSRKDKYCRTTFT